MPLDASTSITLYGVECWDETVEERFGRTESSAQRTLVCRWENRQRLVAAILPEGPIEIIGNVIVNEPMRYPDAGHLTADEVVVRGEGVRRVGSAGMVAYEWARLTIRYRTLELGFNPEETGSEAIDFAGDVGMLPATEVALRWSSDGEDVPAEYQVPVPITEVTFVKARRNVRSLPVQAILLAAQRPVNSVAFLGAPAGTVKFEGAQSFRRLTTGGVDSYDISLKFTYRPQGWNTLFRPSTGLWEAVTSKGSGEGPMLTSDLGALLNAVG